MSYETEPKIIENATNRYAYTTFEKSTVRKRNAKKKREGQETLQMIPSIAACNVQFAKTMPRPGSSTPETAA